MHTYDTFSFCHPDHLSLYISFSLHIFLSTYLSLYISFSIYIFLPIYLSVYISLSLSDHLFLYRSFLLSLTIFLSIYISLSLWPSLSQCIFLSICLSLYISFCLKIFLTLWTSYSPVSIYLSYSLWHLSQHTVQCTSFSLSFHTYIYLSDFLNTVSLSLSPHPSTVSLYSTYTVYLSVFLCYCYH